MDGRTLVDSPFGPYLSAMAGDNATHRCQPDTGACEFALSVKPLERRK